MEDFEKKDSLGSVPDLSGPEKMKLLARLARGEYRIRGDEIEMLQASCCAAIRKELTQATGAQKQVVAHQRLESDLGLSDSTFREVRSRFQERTGIALPEVLSESLTVWDCYGEADQEFKNANERMKPNARTGGSR